MDYTRGPYARGACKRVDPDRKTDRVDSSASGGTRAYTAALQLCDIYKAV